MSGEVNKVTSCEVCGNTSLVPVLDLGLHPMCDDLVPVGGSRVCREYPIDILYCETCRTAHQHYQVPKDELFPRSYHYRSRFTADVLNGMRQLVTSSVERYGSLAGKIVLDIGCNDGSLLDFFAEQGAKTIGVEPTGAATDAEGRAHVVYNAFLDEAIATKIAAEHGKPDFISFTNVFAHVEDLRGLIASLMQLIGPSTVIIVENHYLGAVLDGNQFDTFYHEHPRTYSATSFVHIARALGRSIDRIEFPKRYGGNIRVFMGAGEQSQSSLELQALHDVEGRFGERFAKLRANVQQWRITKRKQLDDLVARHGPLRAKAFPGRAAILIKLLGLDESTLMVVHEKPGSLKIGNYLPGTRIPIRSDDELFALADKTAPIINLAWHISGEVRRYLAEDGMTNEVIDILGPEDMQEA